MMIACPDLVFLMTGLVTDGLNNELNVIMAMTGVP